MNVHRRIYTRSLHTLIILATIALIRPYAAFGQTSELDIPGGGILTVEGEELTFERTLVEIDGEQVFQEQATWEQGVVARFVGGEFGEIVLETERITAIFDGAEVASLEAGPKVVVTGFGGKARFECADVVIELPTESSGLESYRGVCREVNGYYLADPETLGLESGEDLEVYFTADVATLEPEMAILENPCLSLSDLEKPELAIASRSITFRIGPHPSTEKQVVLGARAENISIRLFGHRLNLIPFPVWRGFVQRREPGWTFFLPQVGWEGDEGFRLNQLCAYDFADESVTEGPRILFRLDSLPLDRTYPELGFDVGIDGATFDLRAGYRREEDENGDPVPVRAEPEARLSFAPHPLDSSGLGISGSLFWGHLRDMTIGTDLDRWGFSARLDRTPIPFGEFKLSGNLEFIDYFYQGGDNYRLLEGGVRLRYVDPPRWGATLSYRNIWKWGETPFRFDVPQVTEEIGLREQTRLSDRCGAGFDWAWDFCEDDFERQECHLTYIFDSFQVSMGWDFENETVRVRFDLPGSLR